MKNQASWPYWAKEYKSARDFRKKKRGDVRRALKALDELRLGCAFTPAQSQIEEAEKHLELAKELMSVKRWKR